MTATHRLERTVADVVAIASIAAPTFAEEARIAWLEERLADAPGTRRRDEAGNLVWTIGEQPDVLVAAHVDTVFDAATPLEIVRRDTTMHGPGVGDNAAAVAVVVSVVEELAAEGDTSVAVAFTVGEEGLGNLRGARLAVSELGPRLVIAVEGHGLDRVVVDGVGSVRIRISVAGPGGHPWVNRGTPSALHALLDIGARLVAEGRSDPVVNVGTVAGGRSVNSIAESAELLVEARSLDPDALAAFEREVDALAVPKPLELSVAVLGRRPAGSLDRESELLQTVLEVREELGLGGILDAGSTDANVALGAGIPALTLGVTTGGGMHTTAEWIDWPSLAIGAAQIERTLRRLT